ncbi:MAG: 50S ribosomal protein L37e [Candidatus Hermodarchaeia archaeon]|nr:50S ribosomal protein L37e [Candidatus Woesearchaeota archaeon]
MSKGTASMGKRSGKKTHIYCRRCGKHTYHARKKECSSCGYGVSSKLRKYSWNTRRGKTKI